LPARMSSWKHRVASYCRARNCTPLLVLCRHSRSWRCARRGLSVDPAGPAESGEATGLPAARPRSTEPARAMAESGRATARRADTAWAAAGRAAGRAISAGHLAQALPLGRYRAATRARGPATAQHLAPGLADSGRVHPVRVHRVVRRARVDQAVRLVQARPVPDHWAACRAARATAGRPASQRCRQEVR